MSLWRCPSCQALYAPNRVFCALCDVPTELVQPETFTVQPARVHGYLMPPRPYRGPDRRRSRLTWFDYLKLALALFGLAALIGGHLEPLVTHFSVRELLSVGGGISAIVFALLTDPRVFAQIRSIQSVLNPEDATKEDSDE
jgi:hypothetical protein